MMPRECLFNDVEWETLLAAVMAVVAALITVCRMQRQIDQAKLFRDEDLRMRRESYLLRMKFVSMDLINAIHDSSKYIIDRELGEDLSDSSLRDLFNSISKSGVDAINGFASYLNSEKQLEFVFDLVHQYKYMEASVVRIIDNGDESGSLSDAALFHSIILMELVRSLEEAILKKDVEVMSSLLSLDKDDFLKKIIFSSKLSFGHYGNYTAERVDGLMRLWQSSEKMPYRHYYHVS